MLKKLYIHNFKSFWHSSFEFGKLNCIIAPNNTGKSNLIEAIELIDTLLFHKERDVGFLNNQKNFRYKENTIVLKPEFQIEKYVLEVNEFMKYRCNIIFNINLGEINNIDMQINGYIKSTPIVEDEKIQNWVTWSQFRSYDDDIENDLLEYSKHKEILDKKKYTKFVFKYNLATLSYSLDVKKSLRKSIFNLLRLQLDSKENLTRPIEFKNIFVNNEIFTSHYFHAHMIKEQQIMPKTLKLNKEGTNLISFLSGLRKPVVEDISMSLIGEVEQINGIKLSDEAHKRLYFLENEYKVSLEDTSDGTVHFIAIMSAILGNKNSMALLIEEPERHMHMKVLSYILNTMRDDDKQIFFTTHSTEILQQLKLDEILFIFRDYNGNTQGQRAKDIPNIKKIMKLFKGDLVEMIQTGVLGEYDE